MQELDKKETLQEKLRVFTAELERMKSLELNCPHCGERSRIGESNFAPMDVHLHKVEGGGTRSEKAPTFDLMPGFGSIRTARRFGLGAVIHGPENWKKSCTTEPDAYKWCLEAYNHMMHHAIKMRNGVDPEDDHVGAIGWAVEIFAYVEHRFDKPWVDLHRG